MLSAAARTVLNRPLEKYRPGQSEPILVGGVSRLKPALQLMSDYRLKIEEVRDSDVITSYIRWVEAVQVRGENRDVYLMLSPYFKRVWLDTKKRLLDHVAQCPVNIGLRRRQIKLRLTLQEIMNRKQVITLLALIAGMFLDHAQAQHRIPPPYSRPSFAVPDQQQVVARSNATDAARYLAGLPIAPESPLIGLTRDPRWIAHSNVMNAGFSKLEQRLLNNLRSWQAEFLAPVTTLSTCLYFFSGPDFMYADTLYPNCNTFVMASLESIESLPELQTVPAVSLQNSLQAIEAALNTYFQVGYFETQDLRAYTQRSQLKGILPIIFVFLARSGKEILNVNYLSPSRGGGARGIKITFRDPVTDARKILYYFTADLSDAGLKSNQALLHFCASFGPTNSFLKAPSYLLFQNSFNIARDFLLRVSATILQDDSGIPIRCFTLDRWILRFFGSYTGPLELFKKFYQPDLQQYYATSSPKPLPFGFGYQWNPHDATLILAVRR